MIRDRRMALRIGGASFRVDLRAVTVVLVLALVSAAGIVANVGYGEYPIVPLDVVKTVVGIGDGGGNYDFIVNTLRLPRALVAFLVGVALAVSGAILQGITRNPLAAPDIVGVNAGAGLAAVTLIVVFPSASSALLPPAAFGGAFAVAVLLYLLAGRASSPLRLILIGIGLGAIATALTTTMIVFGEIFQVAKALVWLTGSVYGRTWEHLYSLVPWLLVFVPLSFALSRNLNVFDLGEEVARGLGSRVEAGRGVLLLCSVALAAAAVATAGAIGFVGLIAPHIARRLVGPSYGGLLPTSAMTGGALVVLADLVGRVSFGATEIPAGIVTAAIGAPFFLYLLYRNRDK